MRKARTKSGKVVIDRRQLGEEKSRTLFVVANRVEAAIYSETPEHQLKCLKKLKNPKGRLHESELNSDRPGRTMANSGNRTLRHGLDRGHHHHEKVAVDFAGRVAKELGALRRPNLNTEIVLAAEPHFLGILRAKLPVALRKCVKFEIHRELFHTPEHELLGQIKKAMLRESNPH